MASDVTPALGVHLTETPRGPRSPGCVGYPCNDCTIQIAWILLQPRLQAMESQRTVYKASSK